MRILSLLFFLELYLFANAHIFVYHRFDNPKVIPLLNQLYTKEWRLFHNFFCPSVKLISKKMVASKIIKRYDNPKTPYQRVLESKDVATVAKQKLKEQFKTLNPFQLRKKIEKKLKTIFNTQCNSTY